MGRDGEEDRTRTEKKSAESREEEEEDRRGLDGHSDSLTT